LSAFAIPELLPGEPFSAVFDVGSNVGDFAAQAVDRWPDCLVVAFEPIPQLADAQRARAAGRWDVVSCAVSDENDWSTLYVCENQHTASTMQEPGDARLREFGIVDQHVPIRVPTHTLDFHLPQVADRERLLVKVDVEGHEGRVLAGAAATLEHATTVIVEVQNDPTIFLGSPAPCEVDELLRSYGLVFCGLADAFLSPRGEVLQFDGVWSRADATRRE
jgi:FkbM family methyltransferase